MPHHQSFRGGHDAGTYKAGPPRKIDVTSSFGERRGKATEQSEQLLTDERHAGWRHELVTTGSVLALIK
ncbi:MAG: hypothetical protein NT160_09245, partial [Actinobacteria bacterium]|nr:hypothetical protein [Actinomycetota bacterium]